MLWPNNAAACGYKCYMNHCIVRDNPDNCNDNNHCTNDRCINNVCSFVAKRNGLECESDIKKPCTRGSCHNAQCISIFDELLPGCESSSSSSDSSSSDSIDLSISVSVHDSSSSDSDSSSSSSSSSIEVCKRDSDCDDRNECTLEYCVAGACKYHNKPDLGDCHFVTRDPCLTGQCRVGHCVPVCNRDNSNCLCNPHTPPPRTTHAPPTTTTREGACSTNAQCDDHNPCTDDMCVNFKCLHLACGDHRRCDDGDDNSCTTGVCVEKDCVAKPTPNAPGCTTTTTPATTTTTTTTTTAAPTTVATTTSEVTTSSKTSRTHSHHTTKTKPESDSSDEDDDGPCGQEDDGCEDDDDDSKPTKQWWKNKTTATDMTTEQEAAQQQQQNLADQNNLELLETCGDGVLDADEECDGASDNTFFWHCNDACQFAFFAPPLILLVIVALIALALCALVFARRPRRRMRNY